MFTFRHFLHVLTTMTPETWIAVVVIGFPSFLLNLFLFYAASLKLRYCFRTHSMLDGLSGLAILLMASSSAMAFIYVGATEFIPKPPVFAYSSRLVLGLGFFGGLIMFVVLRPFTGFGRPASATLDAPVEEIRSKGTA